MFSSPRLSRGTADTGVAGVGAAVAVGLVVVVVLVVVVGLVGMRGRPSEECSGVFVTLYTSDGSLEPWLDAGSEGLTTEVRFNGEAVTLNVLGARDVRGERGVDLIGFSLPDVVSSRVRQTNALTLAADGLDEDISGEVLATREQAGCYGAVGTVEKSSIQPQP